MVSYYKGTADVTNMEWRNDYSVARLTNLRSHGSIRSNQVQGMTVVVFGMVVIDRRRM